MLCTPPAFILSQDQTLDKLYIKLESLLSCIEYLFFLLMLFYFFVRVFIFSLELTRHFLTSQFFCTLFSYLLFNFQGPLCTLALRECLNNISQLFRFVNTFFQFFSTFFSFFVCAALLPFSPPFSVFYCPFSPYFSLLFKASFSSFRIFLKKVLFFLRIISFQKSIFY